MTTRSKKEFHVIIPVRYEAVRLPGKPLLDIAGKPLIQHVYERALESCPESVVIATDSEQIRVAAEKFGAKVCMTSSDHTSGTERLAEAVIALGYEDDEIVVNVQGDEPLIPPQLIQQVANDLAAHDNVKVATLCEPIKNSDDIFDPNIVKVVTTTRSHALYFSRAPIPWNQSRFPIEENQVISGDFTHYRHIGLYGYRVGFLAEYMSWDRSPIEIAESLEQLRVLWNGKRIHVGLAKKSSPLGVDTPEDLEKVRALLKSRKE